MAGIHNELRYLATLTRGMRRAFGEPGVWGVERFGETLTPIFDLWSRGEWSYLFAEDLWGKEARQEAGAAGTQATIALLNPLADNRLCVVEGIAAAISSWPVFITMSAEAQVVAQLGTSEGVPPRDSRNFPPAGTGVVTGARLRQGTPLLANVPGAGGELGRLRGPASTMLEPVCLPIVLHPGFAAVVYAEQAATALEVAFSGRARGLVPGERPGR